jgi:hypothetical protein
MRGSTFSFVMCDEAAFWSRNDQDRVLDVVTGFIQKGDPYIVLLSTANEPNDLMDRVMQEEENETIWRRMKMDYTFGIDKVYSPIEIAKAKKAPSWSREMLLRFSAKGGSTFLPSYLERAKVDYDLQPTYGNDRTIAVDPAWSSSPAGILVS